MLKRILLLKPWGDHVAGEIVQVDPVRAGRLILDGTGTEPDGDKAIIAGEKRKPKA